MKKILLAGLSTLVINNNAIADDKIGFDPFNDFNKTEFVTKVAVDIALGACEVSGGEAELELEDNDVFNYDLDGSAFDVNINWMPMDIQSHVRKEDAVSVFKTSSVIDEAKLYKKKINSLLQYLLNKDEACSKINDNALDLGIIGKNYFEIKKLMREYYKYFNNGDKDKQKEVLSKIHSLESAE